jgi:hypothetical protein
MYTKYITHIHIKIKTYLVGQTTLEDRGSSSRTASQLVGKAQHDW